MKRNIKWIISLGFLCAGFFFSSLPESYAKETENHLKAENITTYINEDDGQEKTIFWTKGITPPKMGGKDSHFKKEITNSGGVQYIEYKSPYLPGNGWYDINKSEDRTEDENLCFAAAASNSLHWWLAQNETYIRLYLNQNPDTPRAQEILSMLTPLNSQYGSSIYSSFVKQFANRKEGYWADILHDQFINGYTPKENGGTNDPNFDGENLIQNGPDKRGGYFYPVFGVQKLTSRHYYELGYQALSWDLKNYFSNGDLVLLTYDMGASAHVVTLWGAEFDPDGNLCGVYFSDSDDDKQYGMQRYRIVNSGGKAIATTNDKNTGSLVTSICVLSPGKNIWEQNIQLPQKKLTLTWDNTNLVYNGSPQKPGLTVTGIRPGDDITLEVQGEMTHAGSYTAYAVLGGKDAASYRLPANASVSFTISQASTSFDGSPKLYNGAQETSAFSCGDIITVKVKPVPSAVSDSASGASGKQMALFHSGKQLSSWVKADAYGLYTLTCTADAEELSIGDNTIRVQFSGDSDMTDYFEDVIISLDYAFVPELSPTCEQPGHKSYFTDLKGHFYLEIDGKITEVSEQDLLLAPLNHSWSDWQIISSSTCSSAGYEERSCSVCRLTETRSLDLAEHEWEDHFTIDQQPSCTADGSQSIHCKNCSAKKDSSVISGGHKADDSWTQENGKHFKKCLNGCGAHLSETSCFGGTASYDEKAVCSVCGNPYGEPLKRPDSSESKNDSSSVVIIPQPEAVPSSPSPLKSEKKPNTADKMTTKEDLNSSDSDSAEESVVETEDKEADNKTDDSSVSSDKKDTQNEKEVLQDESAKQTSSSVFSLPVFLIYLIILVLCIAFLTFVIRRKLK